MASGGERGGRGRNHDKTSGQRASGIGLAWRGEGGV